MTSTPRTKAVAFCAAALAGVALSGCSSSSDDRDADPSAGAGKTVTVSKSTPSMVEGKDYSVLTEHPAVVNGELSAYFGQTEKSYVMSTTGTGKSGLPADDNPLGAALVAVDKQSGDATALARHGKSGAPRFVVDAVVSGDTVVWVETTQANFESMPWEMYSLDLASGAEKHIASHEVFGFKNPPWTSDKGLRPQVIGDVVYFVAVDKLDEEKGIRGRSVYRVPVAGGADPALVAPGASEVYVDGMNLQVQLDGRLVGWDPTKGKDGEIAGSDVVAPCGSFANEGVRVTCSGKDLHVDSPKYGKFIVDLNDQDTGYYNATGRWVSFSTPKQAYVLDLKRGRLMAMKGAQSSSTSRYAGDEIEYPKLGQPGDPTPLVTLLPD